MKNVTIIGGGGLGHVCAGVISTHKDYIVNILTGHPEHWSHTIVITDLNGKTYNGTICTIDSKPEVTIKQSDIVLLCLPGYLIRKTLIDICPFLNPETAVGTIVSSTGFFFQAHEVLPKNTVLFGFQRVPYIARVNEYGKSASLLGYKKEIELAVENSNTPEELRATFENIFDTPTNLLHSYYEACLTNSNPILHTGRLYTMWHDWDGTPYDHNILFYKEWDIASAQALIDMDEEFFRLLKHLPVRKGIIPTLLDYYESKDAVSLCKKISSIPAFQTILSPMKKIAGGWVPDFSSRYFTEDFPFGLKYIKVLASQYNEPTPFIDTVLNWGLEKAESATK